MQWTNQTEALYPSALHLVLYCHGVTTLTPVQLPCVPSLPAPLLSFFLHFPLLFLLLHLLSCHSFDTLIILSFLPLHPSLPSSTHYSCFCLPPQQAALIISFFSSSSKICLSSLLPHSVLIPVLWFSLFLSLFLLSLVCPHPLSHLPSLCPCLPVCLL